MPLSSSHTSALVVGPGGALLKTYVPQAWTPCKTPNLLDLLRSGSTEVYYLVLLELPFSLQLESEYEVKTVLKDELQNVSHNEDSCQSDQSEPRPERGVEVRDTSLDRSLWAQVPALG